MGLPKVESETLNAVCLEGGHSATFNDVAKIIANENPLLSKIVDAIVSNPIYDDKFKQGYAMAFFDTYYILHRQQEINELREQWEGE